MFTRCLAQELAPHQVRVNGINPGAVETARLDDIGPHYATTLRLWREAFFAKIDKVRALGYSEQFIRLWNFYLCYCEGGFIERQLGDVQMLLVKPGCRLTSA